MKPNDALQLAKEALAKALEEKKLSQDLIKNLGPSILDALKPSIEKMAENALLSREELLKAISGIEINVPKVDVPQAQVEVKIPEIKVPQPIVNVAVPDIKIPEIKDIKIPSIKVPKPEVTVNFDATKIKIPDIKMPDEMNISGWVGLMGYDKGLLSNPLPVQLRDAKGNPVTLFENLTQVVSGGGRSGGIVTIGGATATVGVVTINPDGSPTYTTSSSGSGSTTVSLVNVDGTYYNSDNPLPVTFSAASIQPVSQVSGHTWSVSVNDIFRTTVASNLINADDRLRVSLETGGSGLTDAELRASPVPVQQVSGYVDSVYVLNPVDNGDAATALRIVQAGNSISSSKSMTHGINGLGVWTEVATNEGSSINALRVVNATDAVTSVNVTGGTISVTQPVIVTDGGTAFNTSATPIYTVYENAVADTNNSTITPLLASQTYTGIASDVSSYSAIMVSVAADQNSAANGLKIQFSHDGVNWDFTEAGGYDYNKTTTRVFQVPIQTQFFRIQYVNGGLAQASFRLQTFLVYAPQSFVNKRRFDEALPIDFASDVVTAGIRAQNSATEASYPVYSTTPHASSGTGLNVFTVNAKDQGDAASALRVVVAGNSDSSVVVNSGTLTGITNTLIVNQLSGAVYSVYANNPVNQGDAATALRVVIAGNSDASVVVNSGTLTGITNTLTVDQVSGATWSVSVNDSFRTTVATDLINADNRLRVSLETGGSGLTDSELRASPVPTQQVSGYADSVNVIQIGGNAVVVGSGYQDNALRVVNATDAITSVNVTGSTGSVAATIVDSGGVGYSGSNPVPITIISGALTSSIAVGATLHDAADDGDAPIKAGGIAMTANPTAVAGGDRVAFRGDDIGRQLTRPIQVRDLIQTARASSTNVTETTLLAGSASTFHDLIYVLASNNSTGATAIDIRSGTANGILMTIDLPANGVAGVAPPVPIPQDVAANAWTFTQQGDVSTTTVVVTALFSKEV